MFLLALFASLLQQSKGLIPQATTVPTGHSIRYELFLAANNDKENTAFIPRNKADLEDVLLNVASANLRDGIHVEESTVKYAKTIYVLPFQYSVTGYTGNLVEDYVTPYFMDSYRIVSCGDTFSTRGGEWAPQFKIVSIEGYVQQDGDSYIVGPDTKIIRSRGVVEENRQERDSQFQDGSARSFHVNTVSDIRSDIRTDKLFNNLFSYNIENKNSKMFSSKKPSMSGSDNVAYKVNEDIRDFQTFLLWKYRNCRTVKDLLLATNSEAVLPSLSEEGSQAPASLIINSFFLKDSSSLYDTMKPQGVSVEVCGCLFSVFNEEGKIYTKTVYLNSMEIQLGKNMRQQAQPAKKYLVEKYKNFPSMIDLLKMLGTRPEKLSKLSKEELNISTLSIIENFIQIHKISFLDQMEERGCSFECSAEIFVAFHRDMSNVPLEGQGRRWPFRTLIKNIFSSVASLFNRPKSTI